MTPLSNALISGRPGSLFAGERKSLCGLLPAILASPLFRLRPAAYLGALRPQPPKAAPLAPLQSSFLLSNPLKLL
jgi:hypothetical protein